MEIERPSKLRTVGTTDKDTAASGAQRIGSGIAINTMAELVVDLLSATGLIAPDQLALVRGRGPVRSRRRSSTRVSPARGDCPLACGRWPGGPRRPGARGCRQRRGGADSAPCTRARGRDSVRARGRCVSLSPSPTREFFTASTSSARDKVHAQSSASRRVRTSSPSCAAWRARLRGLRRPRAVLEEAEDDYEDGEEETDDLEADDGVSDARSSASSTRSSSRPPRMAPPTSTSSRRRIPSSSASGRRRARRSRESRSGWRPASQRLKVLAKLDIAERRKPQDGWISLNAAAAGRMLDIRVATLPTVEGGRLSCAS